MPAGLELRRAQGKPDPLVLVVQETSVPTAMPPRTPVVELALRDADVGGESFHVTEGGSYRSGRFARCQVEGAGPGGAPLEVLPRSGFMGGGFSGRRRLSPGESLPLAIELGDHVRFSGPGEYQVRVLYHDGTTSPTRRPSPGGSARARRPPPCASSPARATPSPPRTSRGTLGMPLELLVVRAGVARNPTGGSRTRADSSGARRGVWWSGIGVREVTCSGATIRSRAPPPRSQEAR